MSLSQLPLSYCTNVHPGRSVAEVEAGLDRYTVKVREGFAKPLAAGLWLAEPVIAELLATHDGVKRFADGLAHRGLTCHTLNAFPFGDFHSERVKEKVYLPDWTEPSRLAYTIRCAQVLAQLLAEGVEGSISTLPLGFKGFSQPADFPDRCADRLIECAKSLNELFDRTGKLIRLAVEPEPFCVLETTAEAIEFFSRLWERAEKAGALGEVALHIGLCYDICHQAVEFEEIAPSISSLNDAGVRINKVHLSCAIELNEPADNGPGLDALERYVEPRYLHQTIAQSSVGQILQAVDLTHELIDDPCSEFASAQAWRIHFHVPVDAERLGPLGTTRSALIEALPAIAALDYAPHLEVETYTWEVLPGAEPGDLVAGLTRELQAADELISRARK